jgi:hypothetical protein
LGEQLSRGLVNSNENSLSDISQLAKELHGAECSLTIQTRSRFVKEDKNRRLRDEFDTNSDTLALLNAETSADAANESVLQVAKFQQIDDCVNVSELLLTRSLTALSEKCREFQGFANSGVWLVNIKLLAVASGSLEGDRERATIDHDLAMNCTIGLALSQNIE